MWQFKTKLMLHVQPVGFAQRTVFLIKHCTARCFILNRSVVQWEGFYFTLIFLDVTVTVVFKMAVTLCKYVIFTRQVFFFKLHFSLMWHLESNYFTRV